jgi:hypothetical protein
MPGRREVDTDFTNLGGLNSRNSLSYQFPETIDVMGMVPQLPALTTNVTITWQSVDTK